MEVYKQNIYYELLKTYFKYTWLGNDNVSDYVKTVKNIKTFTCTQLM